MNMSNGTKRLENCESLIFDFIYNMVLRDAALRNAYTGSSLHDL